ncbi:class I SAM-dependent methyltransferase [Winogradskya consettensis]|uniref:O-methyltransferase n=1 Tax=Winogradskya consettensis TaxID=113560 RepID=A0A919T365_9ACTN|nr:O-methyltransferase [Actinoplanes consettensis]GIM85590.1 O-methyltransferase [Actinoplanes consettensis]
MADIVDPVIADYLVAHSTPADDVLRELAAETRARFPGPSGMQVSQDEGALLTLLVRLTGARQAVEVGTFTGYSSICIARGLAEGGRLLCCDVSEEFTALARDAWKRAGLDDRIELRIAPALETLRALPDEPVLDFAFIDADKPGYPGYYEQLVRRLRPGGLIVLDNVLQGGDIINPSSTRPNVPAMRALNDLVTTDNRVESVMLPVRDGITLARKK